MVYVYGIIYIYIYNKQLNMPFYLEMSKNITKQLYILYGIHH